jgi:hypothetical protein
MAAELDEKFDKLMETIESTKDSPISENPNDSDDFSDSYYLSEESESDVD